MPAPSFFRNLGLFVFEDFLDCETLAHIQSEMSAAKDEKGMTAREGSEEGIVDETSRKVLAVDVCNPTATLVRDRLLDIRPRLEEHFHLPLSGCKGPFFLTNDQTT